MDSMRHLSTSLPGSRQRTDDSTSDILGDFKAAALSVTNLYKTAAKSQERARAAGYQDALDDLLAFLDKENLGLMDGEGWRVRQWATERLDGERTAAPRQATDTSSAMADDEDDASTAKEDEKDDERSSSPEIQRKPRQDPLANSSSDLTEDDSTSQHRRVVSEPPQYAPLQGDFTFQSSHAYPSNHDRDMELDNTNSSTPQHQSTTATSNPSSTETVRIIPRSSGRNSHRREKRNNNNTTTEARLPTLNFNLGSGAGSKRKLPYPDFFDISGINDNQDRKDGNGGGNNGSGRGGKRGRHV